jgi:hypothetical protein
MGDLTANFDLREFRCRCGCGGHLEFKGPITDLAVVLQEIRDRLGQPIVVHSGYRCRRHNLLVGGH